MIMTQEQAILKAEVQSAHVPGLARQDSSESRRFDRVGSSLWAHTSRMRGRLCHHRDWDCDVDSAERTVSDGTKRGILHRSSVIVTPPLRRPSRMGYILRLADNPRADQTGAFHARRAEKFRHSSLFRFTFAASGRCNMDTSRSRRAKGGRDRMGRSQVKV